MLNIALGVALAAVKIITSSSNSLVPPTPPAMVHHTNSPPTSAIISGVTEIGSFGSINTNLSFPVMLFTTNLGKTWQIETNWDYYPIFTNIIKSSNFITGAITIISSNCITNTALLRYKPKTNGVSRFFKLMQQ